MARKLLSCYYPDQFLVSSPELAYFLGFLWGDGYLSLCPKRKQTIVSIEILSEDMKNLVSEFNKFCNWNVLKSIKKKLSLNCYTRIYSGDKRFYRYLVGLGFLKKSRSHHQVLKFLDKKHWKDFFRGLLDSDGSIARYKGHCVINFASEYGQDWSGLEDFCQSIDVKFRVNRRVLPDGRRQSSFTIGGQDAFFQFLGKLYQENGPHLSRKRAKYVEIRQKVTDADPTDVVNGNYRKSS